MLFLGYGWRLAKRGDRVFYVEFNDKLFLPVLFSSLMNGLREICEEPEYNRSRGVFCEIGDVPSLQEIGAFFIVYSIHDILV